MSLPRIAVDAMGGDEGVRVMVSGAALARRRHDKFKFLLVGDEPKIKAALENHPNMRNASEILHCEGVVGGHEKPTQALRRAGVPFTEHPYDYVEHGGTAESARQLGVPEHEVVKTLVMQDDKAQPLIVLMHGDRQVSTKNLAREIGAKSVEPCKPDVAQRHSGYLVGGTSPFGTRKPMPVYVEASVLDLPRLLVNGGQRGFLVGLAPQVLVQLLQAKPVRCALGG